MSERFFLVAIRWDQKKGGQMQAVSPGSLTLSTKTSMTIYNMHRMSQTDPNFSTISIVEEGTQYNVCSFFSGYGTSTSPDGFTGNYGKNIIGVAEKVICIFLPDYCVSDQYMDVLAKIASRSLLDAELIQDRIEKIGNYIQSSNLLKNAKELRELLDKDLDTALQLTDKERSLANEYEIRILRYLTFEQHQQIDNYEDEKSAAEIKKLRQRLKETYASMEEVNTRNKLLETYKTQKEQYIKKLEEELRKLGGNELDLQISKAEGNGNNHNHTQTNGITPDLGEIKFAASKDLVIENLKEINSSLEEQIRGISESMKELIEDLKRALIDKENKILQKEAFIEQLQKQVNSSQYDSIRGSMETEISENTSEILIQQYRTKIDTITKELERVKEVLTQKDKQVFELEMELEIEKSAK
jgi:hypothetical protein